SSGRRSAAFFHGARSASHDKIGHSRPECRWDKGSRRIGMAREDTEDAIIAYKNILAQIIENRPSGTRQRLATELGKHRSFVTQITSPIYATPLPARHLATIF